MGKARFQRIYSAGKADGFDDSVTPPWLMVPAGKRRKVLALFNGKGLQLYSTNPSALKIVNPKTNVAGSRLEVTSSWQMITFEGIEEGTASIWAHTGKSVLSILSGERLLDVHVLKKKEVKVAFHYVEDSAKRKTKRTIGGEDGLLTVVNKVFNVQANITFTKKSAATLKVAKDLGDPITYTVLGGSELPELHKLADSTAKINVFFTWEYEPGTGDADAEVDKIGCFEVIFEDKAGRDEGLSMAHEFGHNLGLPHKEAHKKWLMWPYTGDRGGSLSREEILKVYGNA